MPFFTDYRELLDSGTVDAVVTTVPHYLHPEMGIAAIERGIHALVEKPGRRLLEAGRRTQRRWRRRIPR